MSMFRRRLLAFRSNAQLKNIKTMSITPDSKSKTDKEEKLDNKETETFNYEQ